MTEHSLDGEGFTSSVTFSTNDEYLVGGGKRGVRVWRVADGKEMMSKKAKDVKCLVVSRNGGWISAGTYEGDLFVWDANTYEQVWMHKEDKGIRALDFSPDSTRLVVGMGDYATIWDVSLSHRRIRKLKHKGSSKAAKYSPDGNRIATASQNSIRIWDSDDGRLLREVNIRVTSCYNKNLLWFHNHLFVISDDTIKEFDASTGSQVTAWSVSPHARHFPCIVLSHHGEFIAYSAHNTITFWESSAHIRPDLNLIQHPDGITSVAFSSDDQFLAISGHGKIVIQDLRAALPPANSTVPFINITETALNLWKQDRLADTEAAFMDTISSAGNNNYHTLANRAFIRSRLQHWDLAFEDADNSIKIQPSVSGYIAKSVALVRNGNKDEGCRVFDLAFRHCDPADVDHLLLIKAVVMFIAGQCDEALSRIDDLTSTTDHDVIYSVVQAYMHLLLGDSHMQSSDYEGAIHSFERARTEIRHCARPCLVSIALIFGWNFDTLGNTIRHHLCEALYAAGRTKDAAHSFLELVNMFHEWVYSTRSLTEWISDFTKRCLSAPKLEDNTGSKKITQSNPSIGHAVPNSPLLRAWARATLVNCSWKDALGVATDFLVPKFFIYQAICERLKTTDRVNDAVECFQKMNNELAKDLTEHDERENWAVDFKQSCAEKLEYSGDKAVHAQRLDGAITQYSVALSLSPFTPENIYLKRSKVYVARGLWEDALDDVSKLMMLDNSPEWSRERVLAEWAKVKLIDGSWKNAVATASGFKVSRPSIYQALCEVLESTNRVMELAECLLAMKVECGWQVQDNNMEWASEMGSRCSGKLEDLGDSAMETGQFDEAISQYSAALSLDPAVPQCLLVKRCKTYNACGLWQAALNDANKAIELDPLSPWGYESKYAALLKAGRFGNAMNAFEVMLSKISQSSDPEIRELHRQYTSPTKARALIRDAIQDVIRDSPRVLINTTSGRLSDKLEQASAFESLPVFQELILSMTTKINHVHIEQEVRGYYRYAMFSHKWENNEPLFEKVMQTPVYDLEESPTNDKLRMFCTIVRNAGVHWAWSDTCCINKTDHFVLQEALVSMFKWYQGSVQTLVLLRGVRSPSRRGDLVRSVWNSRVWTFQEYHASKVVRFFNEDWTLYRSLTITNHKESHEILSEMEEATGISTRALTSLQPGLDDIREKLCLASSRETTLLEDEAYSLLGIFGISLPVVYGEGDQALGRLLSQLLTSSGDTSILAWTGKPGSFNSCLPARINVFKSPVTSHVPPANTGAKIKTIMIGLLNMSHDLTLITKLYDKLDDLRVPSFSGKRMTLPCIVFELGPLLHIKSEQVFFGGAAALGDVEIRTEEDLSRVKPLYLTFPWIDFLLDRRPAETTLEETDDQSSITDEPLLVPHPSTSAAPRSRKAQLASRFALPFASGGRTAKQAPETTPLPLTEKQMRAIRVLARLTQSFGALLLTPSRNVAAYKRIATENPITVQIKEITPAILGELIEGIRVLDIL